MQQPTKSFTTTSTGITRTLQNEVQVSKAFNLSTVSKSFSPQKIGAKKFNAIWDTGATGTVITQKVAADCGLQQIGIVEVSTANNKRLSPVYLASIFLPNKVYVPQLRVTEGTVSGADVLIGMDIITLGDFAVTNSDGRTTFSYQWPSSKRIDFTGKAGSITTPKIQKPSVKVGRNDPCPCGSGNKYKKCCGK